MSDSCKFHFLMGCGEPLQSRWWVAQPVRMLLMAGRDERASGVRNRRTAERQGDKYKS
jgi:hypothetical protein